MGDENRFRGDLVPVDPVLGLHLGNQLVHDVADVVDVEARPVEGAVGHDGPEHLADRADAAFACGIGALQYEGRCPHPHDQPVAPPVERDRLFLHDLARGRRPGGQEAGAEPPEQVVGGDVVGREDDHPPAAARADPVARDPQGLSAARTGPVGRRVRSPRPDVLGELGMPHGEDPEQEAPVEMIRLLLDLLLERRDAPFEFPGERFPGPARGAQVFEFREPPAPFAVLVETGHDFGVGIVSRERGGEQHPGVVPDFIREHPAVGQFGPLGGGLVPHHQGDSRVSQRIDTRADGQLGHAVERRQPVLGKPEIADDVELLRTGRELDHVGRALDVFESALAPFRLQEPGDVLLDHLPPELFRDRADEHVPAQHAPHVVVAEDPVHARKAEGRAGDAKVDRRRLPLPSPGVDRHPAIQKLREQPSQFGDAVRLRRGLRGRRRVLRRRRCGTRLRRHGRGLRAPRRHGRRRGQDRALLPYGPTDPQPRGVQPAEGQVQGRRLSYPGVVREERDHPFTVAQHVLHEAVEDALGPHLHEDAGPGIIEGVEPLDELDRGGYLLPQQSDHLRDHPRPHGVEFARHVGDDGGDRGLDVHRPQDARQAFTRRGDDPGVEGVAHLQHAGDVARLLECLHGLFDPGGAAADDGLLGAVDVGDDDVIVDRPEDLLDFVDRAEGGRHQAVVLHGALGHLVAARADGLERVFEGDGPGRHQRAVFPEAVPHDHVGSDPVGADQPCQGRLRGQHRRLRDRRLLQAVFRLPHRRLVRFVKVDAVRKAAAEQRRHRAVGLREHLRHDRFGVPERPQHVDVLRPLPREQESDLGRRPFPVIDSLGTQRLPSRGLVFPERLERPPELVGELRGVAVIDRQAEWCPQVGLHRGRRLRRPPRGGLPARALGAPHERRLRCRPQDQGPPQRRLQVRRRARFPVITGDRDPGLRLARDPARDVFLQDHVEVGSPETEGADARAPHLPRGDVPRFERGVDLKRGLVEIDVRIGAIKVQAGGDLFLFQTERGLQDTGGAGPPLEVADVGFHRTEGQGAARQAEFVEDFHQRLQFGGIPHARAGPVSLDQVPGDGPETRVIPGAAHAQLLADRVGSRDPLPLSVARGAHGAHHGVNPVAVALGVGQPLHQERHPPFAHDEAVGSLRVGARPRGGERSDLAELHEGGGAHVGVDAAGQHGVVVVVVKSGDRRRDRRHG